MIHCNVLMKRIENLMHTISSYVLSWSRCVIRSYKTINPANGQETNKTVGAMNYYAYRIMIRENQENHILKVVNYFISYCWHVCENKTERLNYIRFNQRKLRCDGYIHLRDAINKDTNVNNIGQMVYYLHRIQAVQCICMNTPRCNVLCQKLWSTRLIHNFHMQSEMGWY